MQVPRTIDLTAEGNWKYVIGLGRALAGAILFSLPMLMTMEMWWLGFYMDPLRLLLFIASNLVILVGLSRLSGFEKTASWDDDLMDAFAAYAVAAVWSAVILVLLGVLRADMPLSEIVGKIAIQSVPASFGAMIGGKQMGAADTEGKKEERSSYVGELFLMVAGAMFLSFNVAPTEEMILIAFQMTAVQGIALVATSLILLHLLVYTVGLKGHEKPAGPTSFWSIFLRFSVVGYALTVLVSLYVLWTFGRVDGTASSQIVGMVAVLAFPGAIGAALARLVV